MLVFDGDHHKTMAVTFPYLMISSTPTAHQALVKDIFTFFFTDFSPLISLNISFLFRMGILIL